MGEEGYDKERYTKWKKMVPYMYDWFANHNLLWPSLSCRWGPEDGKEQTFKRKQRLYISEQTDGSEPNKLLVVTADICKPRVAAAENLSGFNEANRSPYIKAYKTILHPGEVNKIRECPLHPGIVVTHTDAPELFVWNVEGQPNRAGEPKGSTKPSTADLVLTGHKDNAEFALGLSNAEPLVASGGKDQTVCVWSLADHVTSLTSVAEANGSEGGGAKQRHELGARLVLKGHSDTIEDVCWMPNSGVELASVGDDYRLLFWDSREGSSPVLKVEGAHGEEDLHTVDWSALSPELVATGSADGSLKVWDRRNLSESAMELKQHQGAIMRVEWCPHRKGVLASGGEDRLICIWDLERSAPAAPGLPQQLMFQHAGHRSAVVDFQWSQCDPWTIVSVSDDVDADLGGGTLQMWRVTDLLTRPEEEVLAELEQHREFIITGKRPAEEESAVAAPAIKAEEEGGREGEGGKEGATLKAKEEGEDAKQREEKQAGEEQAGGEDAGAAAPGAAVEGDTTAKEGDGEQAAQAAAVAAAPAEVGSAAARGGAGEEPAQAEGGGAGDGAEAAAEAKEEEMPDAPQQEEGKEGEAAAGGGEAVMQQEEEGKGQQQPAAEAVEEGEGQPAAAAAGGEAAAAAEGGEPTDRNAAPMES